MRGSAVALVPGNVETDRVVDVILDRILLLAPTVITLVSFASPLLPMTRRVELHKVEGLVHVLGMLIAYFLQEKIVVVILFAITHNVDDHKESADPDSGFGFPSDYCGRRNKPQ
jgi:hypothetical protein